MSLLWLVALWLLFLLMLLSSGTVSLAGMSVSGGEHPDPAVTDRFTGCSGCPCESAPVPETLVAYSMSSRMFRDR